MEWQDWAASQERHKLHTCPEAEGRRCTPFVIGAVGRLSLGAEALLTHLADLAAVVDRRAGRAPAGTPVWRGPQLRALPSLPQGPASLPSIGTPRVISHHSAVTISSSSHNSRHVNPNPAVTHAAASEAADLFYPRGAA